MLVLGAGLAGVAGCGQEIDQLDVRTDSTISAASITLSVRETAGVARQGEVIKSGVPIPRSLNLTTNTGLTLVDAAGARIPAEFKVTARWNAGKSTTAPIQWLLVTFPATIA